MDGFQLSATYIFQPGQLLDFGNLFYYGKLDDINTGTRSLDRWFNTDGFEQMFPTRVDGLRSDIMNEWNGSLQRDFRIRESVSFRVRFDAMNLQNRSWFNGPSTDPVSTDFGKVSGTSGSNRWVQLTARLQF